MRGERGEDLAGDGLNVRWLGHCTHFRTLSEAMERTYREPSGFNPWRRGERSLARALVARANDLQSQAPTSNSGRFALPPARREARGSCKSVRSLWSSLCLQQPGLRALATTIGRSGFYIGHKSAPHFVAGQRAKSTRRYRQG